MRKALLALLLCGLVGCQKPAPPKVALQVAHSATLTWTASPSAGVTGYNVYRAPCTGTVTGSTCSADGTFAKINAAAVTGLTYTDTAISASTSYDWYVTAVCAACNPSESGPSGHWAATVPGDQPQPPSNLTITTIARQTQGSKTQIVAKWTAVTGTVTNYVLSEIGDGILAQGTVTSPNGNYALNWSGKVTPPGSALNFKVCDQSNYCVNQNI